MAMMRRVHRFLCILLVAATSAGTVSPVRACGCATPHQHSRAIPRGVASTQKANPAPVMAKSCCHGGSDTSSSCCNSISGNTAACSCGDHTRAVPPTSSTPLESQESTCECAWCDCGTEHTPPVAPAPKPSSTTAGEPITLGSPEPFVLLPLFTNPSRLSDSTSVSPPSDLVITLSRLTC